MWLKQRRYAASSISTYSYHLRCLLAKADELECCEATRALRDAWRPITDALGKFRRTPKTIAQFAISKGQHPSSFCETDLNAWAEWMERRGRQHRTVRMLKGNFRQAITSAGLEQLLPSLNCRPIATTYRIPTGDMPEPLRSEVIELLAWKTARFSKGRPQWTRHRPISARLLERCIARLYGFAKDIGKFSGVESIATLFTEEVVTSYVEWCLNKRNLTRSSLQRLSMIYGAVRHHPKYKNQDLGWFIPLFDQLPEDNESLRNEKKAKKYVPYQTLRTIPEKIRAIRLNGKLSTLEASWLVHDELLIAWLTTLPRRQRNIREC